MYSGSVAVLNFFGIALLPTYRWLAVLFGGDIPLIPDWLVWGASLISWGCVYGSCLLSFKRQQPPSFSCFIFSGLSSLLMKLYSDAGLIFTLIKRGIFNVSFSEQLSYYLEQEGLFFCINVGMLVMAVLIRGFKTTALIRTDKTDVMLKLQGACCVVIFPWCLSALLPIFQAVLSWDVPVTDGIFSWTPLPPELMSALHLLSAGMIIGFLLWLYGSRIPLNVERFSWLGWFQVAATSLAGILLVNVLALLLTVARSQHINSDLAADAFYAMIAQYEAIVFPLLPILLAFIVIIFMTFWLKKKLFDETDKAEETSGYFGSAVFLKSKEYERFNFYKSEKQIPIGMDEQKRLLYAPLDQKMTLAPKGTGKSACSSIPVLLSYEGPVFALDVKGELWATTARYRHEVLKRDVVVIDPFGITRGDDFSQGKPEALLKEYCFNPFDWLPEEGEWRDRILNTFAASFIVEERGPVKHFDENAKILIRGYIDYIMTFPKESRNLSKLYQLMSESPDDATLTFEHMALCGGRAGAAANQIMRVGSDERGSILSTAYRQIDWIGDRNLGKLLSESNFDLKDFLKGNMDIFVVLPPDQVKEHNRLVRMLMALLLGILVQSNPSDLPKEKMLILLDEIAQLGYCPDVEECIEVLRAWGVVVWSVFQTLSQVEIFEKPDLLKGSTIKQIFTNDDTKTMEWIQTLGGKKTVVTKTVSTNTGQSRQTSQMFTTNRSSGEGESVQETGVDLLPLNEIREMPFDEQWLFIAGQKPIRCKKAWYFEHPYFAGKFDRNPLENKGAV